ncbi:MAG: DUF501 domain-containing protein [Actinomycetota bacterium]
MARRCSCGLPQVIETDPRLEDGAPFPTLWWLTCRMLGSALGRLEATGFMIELNERLATDPAMASELARCTERYVRRRDAIEPLGASKHPGGGPERVKCLHAHVAHHLMTGDNPVGAAALEALAWTDPTEPCVSLP